MPETRMTNMVVVWILPNPARGDTTAPARKPAAPKIADAAPVCSLPASMAMDEVEVKTKPTENIIRKVVLS